MFRKFSLCAILSLLLAGAVSAGAGYPIVLGIGALILLAVYAPVAGEERRG